MKIETLLKDSQDTYISRRLLCHVLSMSMEELILSFQKNISDSESKLYRDLYKRCVREWEPLAYVLWYEIFDGEKFFVDTNTLIPRPETEYFAPLVKKCFSSNGTNVLVDVGTGSGCIGVSLMNRFGSQFSKAYLLDISKPALDIAQQNARRILSPSRFDKLCFLESDLLGAIAQQIGGDHVVVVANLPYIPENFSGVEEDVKTWEPWLALYSWADGLAHYRKLIVQVHQLFLKTPKPLIKVRRFDVLMEMMRDQYDLLKDEFPDLWVWSLYDTFHENIVIAWLTLRC